MSTLKTAVGHRPPLRDHFSLRSCRILHCRHVDSAMPLEQALVGDREKWEPIEIVLVVDFHTFRETGIRISSGDEADQHTVHINLIAVWCSPTADTPAVRKAGVDSGIDGEDIAGKTVGYRDRPIEVDRIDDVCSGSLQRGYNTLRQ